MYQIEEHVVLLRGVVTKSFSDESSSDGDSYVEITSGFDENENKLFEWTSYLQLTCTLLSTTVIYNLDRTNMCGTEPILLETKREHFSLKFLWGKNKFRRGGRFPF